MLDQYHFEQHHRVYAWPSVVFAVQPFYHFVESVEVYPCIDFSQQMSLCYQTFRIHYFQYPSVQFPSFQHLPHPFLFYHINVKRPSLS